MDTILQHNIEAQLRKLANKLDITSAWLCEFSFEGSYGVAVAEYISFNANLLEQDSDIGEVYPEEDLDFIAWLRDAKLTGYIIHLDELDRNDPDWQEYVEAGVYTAGYMPVVVAGQTWGFIEFWESRDKRIFTDAEFDYVGACSKVISELIIANESPNSLNLAS